MIGGKRSLWGVPNTHDVGRERGYPHASSAGRKFYALFLVLHRGDIAQRPPLRLERSEKNKKTHER